MEKDIEFYLEKFCDSIGSRPKGSEANKIAAKFVEEEFKHLGFKIEKQEFPSMNWKLDDLNVKLGNQELKAIANGFCIPCEIKAPYICASTFEELESIDLKDKILVIYGELSKREIESKPKDGIPIFFPPESAKLYLCLEKQWPLALVIVKHDDYMMTMLNDHNFPIPSISVPISSAMKILEGEGKESLSITVKSSTSMDTSWNVLGFKPGIESDKVVINSHFDTKFFTVGAYDNASGMSVFLSLAKMLASSNLKYGVEFIAHAGEEFQGLERGSERYLSNQNLDYIPFKVGMKINQCEQFKNIMAALNVDKIGIMAGTDTIGVAQSSHKLKEIVLDCKKKYPGVLYRNAKPVNDIYPFFSYGVPCICYSSLKSINIEHSIDDTKEWLSIKKLSQAKSLCYDVILNLMNCSLDSLRKI